MVLTNPFPVLAQGTLCDGRVEFQELSMNLSVNWMSPVGQQYKVYVTECETIPSVKMRSHKCNPTVNDVLLTVLCK